MKQTLFASATVLAFIAAYLVCTNYLQPLKGESSAPVRAEGTTLTGEYLCVPHTSSTTSQSDTCVVGLKTEDGKYYLFDFNQASYAAALFNVGDRMKVVGTITPMEAISTGKWRPYPLSGVFSVTESAVLLEKWVKPYQCNADARVCPDGSYIGRIGPTCQFKPCPPAEVSNARLETTLGQKVTGAQVSITPTEIVQDSRCPGGVQCVRAGTVELKVTIVYNDQTSTKVLTLGEPLMDGYVSVVLNEVSPYPTSVEDIPESRYRFVFSVQKASISN